MKRSFLFLLAILILVFQSACGTPSAATQAPSPAAASASPSPAPPPTATATLALPVVAGTAVPSRADALTVANIEGITELARWGSGQIMDAAYSPDGKSIAVATAIGVTILDADALTPTMSIATESPVNAVAFSPEGAILVTGQRDNSVVSWNLADGTEFQSYEGLKKQITDPERAPEQVSTVAFSEDGSLLAAGSSEGYVNVWNVSDGTVVQSLTDHVLQVSRVFFSSDGQDVFSASLDGTVRLTNLADGQLVRAFGGQAVRDAALSADGKMLATNDQSLYGTDGFLILWDVEAGEEVQRIRAGDYSDHIQSMAFAPDGLSIATAWSDYDLSVWSVSDGSMLGSLEDLKPKERLPENWFFVVYPVVRFSPDGANLMWAGDDSVALLDSNGTSLIKQQVVGTSLIHGIALSPDGQTLASNERSSMRLRHFPDGTLLADQEEMFAFGSMAFALDGESIAAGFLDSEAEHAAAMVWPVGEPGPPKILDASLPFAWSVAAFTPDGQALALGVSKEVVLFSTTDGSLIRTIHSGLTQDFVGMEFSGDGTLLAVSGGNQTRLLQVEDGKRLMVSSHAGSAIAFSPDGTLLAGSDYEKGVLVWKVPTNEAVLTLADNPDNIQSLRFSSDGTMLVGGLADGSITAWSIPDGAVLNSWPAHSRPVTGLVFSPDGRLLVSSSYDGTIRVWGLKP